MMRTILITLLFLTTLPMLAFGAPGFADVNLGEYRSYAEQWQGPYTLGVMNTLFGAGLVRNCPGPATANIVRAMLLVTGSKSFPDSDDSVTAILRSLSRLGCRLDLTLSDPPKKN